MRFRNLVYESIYNLSSFRSGWQIISSACLFRNDYLFTYKILEKCKSG